MAIPDLWPDEINEKSDAIMPVTILRQQAMALTKRTKGIIEGVINSEKPDGPGGQFVHEFKLVAPALDNYAYELFFVQHGIAGYPAGVIFQRRMTKVQTQEDFIEALKLIFNHETTKRTIQALLAQSTS